MFPWWVGRGKKANLEPTWATDCIHFPLPYRPKTHKSFATHAPHVLLTASKASSLSATHYHPQLVFLRLPERRPVPKITGLNGPVKKMPS